MNISQSKLENAVTSKMTSGYLAMDSKNTILWGSLTALFISSNVITYTNAYNGGWEGAILAQKATMSIIKGYNNLEAEIIRDYEATHNITSISHKTAGPVPFQYYDEYGNVKDVTPDRH